MKCSWHLCNNEAKLKYCSKKCSNKFRVDKRRKNLKKLAVEYKGGFCTVCNYSKCVGALVFHHLDPNQKDFGIGHKGCTKSWENLKKELDKCVLLCQNCHSEEHEKLNNSEVA